jgi:hypothetical protein
VSPLSGVRVAPAPGAVRVQSVPESALHQVGTFLEDGDARSLQVAVQAQQNAHMRSAPPPHLPHPAQQVQINGNEDLLADRKLGGSRPKGSRARQRGRAGEERVRGGSLDGTSAADTRHERRSSAGSAVSEVEGDFRPLPLHAPEAGSALSVPHLLHSRSLPPAAADSRPESAAASLHSVIAAPSAPPSASLPNAAAATANQAVALPVAAEETVRSMRAERSGAEGGNGIAAAPSPSSSSSAAAASLPIAVNQPRYPGPPKGERKKKVKKRGGGES